MMTTAPSEVETPYVCPHCDRAFTKHQGLGRHLAFAHADVRERTSVAPKSTSIMSEVDQQLAEIVAPLRAQRRQIEHKIEDAMSDLQELRRALAKITHALKPFEPPKPKTKSNAGGRSDAAKLNVTRAFLSEHADELADGFTGDALHRAMKAHGITPMPSGEKLRELFETLRDEGVLRADKVVKGGGMNFVLCANGADHA